MQKVQVYFQDDNTVGFRGQYERILAMTDNVTQIKEFPDHLLLHNRDPNCTCRSETVRDEGKETFTMTIYLCPLHHRIMKEGDPS